MEIIFVDNRKSIVEKVAELGIKSIHGDYFQEALKIPRHVLVSASNPHFTFGGGFDRQLQYNFPLYCEHKQQRTFVGNERIGNICFTITVDDQINSNKELVRSAITFALENTQNNETLILTGLGTFIGGLPEDEFVEILDEALTAQSLSK